MHFQKTHTVSITRFSSSGLGIAEISEKKASKSIEIPYTLPGEQVRVIESGGKKKTYYTLDHVLKPSKARVEPECPYFQRCGGCLLLHASSETQAAFKVNQLQKLLKKNGVLASIEPIQTAGHKTRRRFRFEGLKKEGTVYLGLQKYKSHQIINLESCAVAHPLISSLLTPLKAFLSPYLSEKKTFTLHVTKAANGLDLSFEGVLDSDLDPAGTYDFMQTHSIARFTVGEKTFEKETPYVTFANVRVSLPVTSFLQASEDSETILQKAVASFFTEPGWRLIDLFCGLGTLSVPLSQTHQIDAYESSEKSVRHLNDASKIYALNLNAFQRDLFEDPIPTDTLNGFDGAIINPPRFGMGEKQCQALARSQVKKLCYVSCNPESFVKEAKVLTQGSFYLEKVLPVDQFYGTPHLEVVGYFQQKL